MATVNPIAKVGERLKTERERRGRQYVDVSRATGIYIHHLSALEFGRFDEIPDEDVIEAYVHAYAEHLDLDGAECVAQLRRERGLPERPFDPARADLRPGAPDTDETPAPEPEPPAPLETTPAVMAGSVSRPFRARWVLVPAVLVLLGFVAWWATRTGPEPPPRREPPSLPPPAAAAPVPKTVPAPSAQEPAKPLVTATGTLSIPEFGVGRGVVDHRLVDPTDRFEEGEEVWFWTHVRGGSAGDAVRHVWLREGREQQTISLRVGGPSWRTQSAKTLPAGSAGEWSVEARDDAGRVLARAPFTVMGRRQGRAAPRRTTRFRTSRSHTRVPASARGSRRPFPDRDRAARR